MIEYRPDAIGTRAVSRKINRAIGSPPNRASPFIDSPSQQNQQCAKPTKRTATTIIPIRNPLVVYWFFPDWSLTPHRRPEIPIFQSIAFHWTLATLAILFPDAIFIDGWRQITARMPNMNTLVSLGTGSAYIASCLALIFPNLGLECFLMNQSCC
jgi:Cu2+-exporting ATPase